MTNTANSSSSVRPVATLLALTVLVLCIGSTLLLEDLRKRELRRGKEEILGLNHALSDQTARSFDGTLLALRSAHERLSEGIGLRLTLSSEPVQAMLRSRALGLPQLRSLFVLDHDGRLANSSLVSASQQSFADRDYFLHFARGGGQEAFFSQPLRNRIDGTWTIFISRKLLDARQNFRGVIVASIQFDYFSELYNAIHHSGVDHIRLLHRDGMVIAAFPAPAESVGYQLSIPGELNREGAAASGQLLMEGGSSQEIAVFERISEHPFIMNIAVSEERILESWQQVARLVWGGVSFSVALILAVAFGMLRNLKRRDLLAQALHESDQRYRQLLQSARDAIITIDEAGDLVLINTAAEKMFGVSAEAAQGTAFAHFFSDESIRAFAAWLRQARQPAGSRPVADFSQLTGIAADGHAIPLEAGFSDVRVGGEHFVTMILRDISDRQKAEAELRDSNRQLHELTGALQRVREEERAAMARELHDELGQLLIGIKLELAWIKRRVPADPPAVAEKVASVQQQLSATIDTVRRISTALRPLILDDLGLASAINWLVTDIGERTGMRFELDLADEDPNMGGAVATAMFRIVQESLTNITKYADASLVRIRIVRGQTQWQLSIEDDGQGFTLDDRKRAGFGLTAMRERATLLGGTFEIITAPGNGTRIETTLPLEQGTDKS